MWKTSRWRIVAGVVVAATLLAGCGSDSDDGALEGTVVRDGLGCTILSVDRPEAAPEVAPVEGAVEEVATEVLVEAEEGACTVSAKPYLTLDLVGVKATDGTVFYSTYGEERPLNVQTGQGQLLPALESALSQLQVGGRIRVEVPAAEGYGEAGSPAQGIGPNEDLVFVVDLVSVDATRQYCTENVGIPPAPEGVEGGDTKPTGPIDMPLHPPEELVITTVREGTGPVVAEGDRVALHYLGVSCASGQQFDTSWDRGELFEATAGGDDVIDGFAEGLIGIKVGELRRIEIPAAQAYGDDDLIFLLDAREILPPEPEAPPLPDGVGEPGGAGTAPITGSTPEPGGTEPGTEPGAASGDETTSTE